MEYDPADVVALIAPIERGVADVVYGSRLTGGAPQRAYLFWHLIGNRFLSLLTGVLFNTTLSDMETGYKAFRADVLRSLRLSAGRLRDRARDHRRGLPPQAARLRDADRVLRAHVRRGQEHHVARRLQGRPRAVRGPAAATVSDAPGPASAARRERARRHARLHVPRACAASRCRTRSTRSPPADWAGSCRRCRCSRWRSSCARCAGGRCSNPPSARRWRPSTRRCSSATSSTTSCRCGPARRRASSRCSGARRRRWPRPPARSSSSACSTSSRCWRCCSPPTHGCRRSRGCARRRSSAPS